VKPAPFEYLAPDTVDEAAARLAERGEEAKVLAGGQSLVPMLNMRLVRFETLVDLQRIPSLRHVGVESDRVTLGASVRQCDIEESAELAAATPLLARATPLIGHFQIRNRGTVGGSLAHADPAAEYPAVALALGAHMELQSAKGTRTVPASDFFTGTWETAGRADEILTSVTFPRWDRAGFAIEEVARRHGDFAIAGACAALQAGPTGKVARVAIAMFGVDSTPVRAPAAEASLVGAAVSDLDAQEVGRAAAADLDPPDDLHASAALRRRIAAAVVRRALTTALGEIADA
jgi:carbon-monoxide dehydrogenase medium subunit